MTTATAAAKRQVTQRTTPESAFVVQIEIEPSQAKDFLEYLQNFRSQAASDLLKQQQEREINRLTSVVMVLGQLSRGFFELVQRRGTLTLSVEGRRA